MPDIQSSWNGALAAIAAAGSVGGFVLLLRPEARNLAVLIAIMVFLVGLGVVGLIMKVA